MHQAVNVFGGLGDRHQDLAVERVAGAYHVPPAPRPVQASLRVATQELTETSCIATHAYPTTVVRLAIAHVAHRPEQGVGTGTTDRCDNARSARKPTIRFALTRVFVAARSPPSGSRMFGRAPYGASQACGKYV